MASERKKKSRERRASGFRVVSVEIHEEMIRGLIAKGWIQAKQEGGGLRVTRADIGEGIIGYLEHYV